MTKLQITLTDEETEGLRKQAEKMGYSLTKFVKFLLAKEAYNILLTIQSKQKPVNSLS